MKKSLIDISETDNPRSRTNSIYWNDKGDRKIKFAPPLIVFVDSITKLRNVLCRSYIITIAHFRDCGMCVKTLRLLHPELHDKG